MHTALAASIKQLSRYCHALLSKKITEKAALELAITVDEFQVACLWYLLGLECFDGL